MSWTVHEDEYRTTEPNFEKLLQQVVEDDEESPTRPPGKYTKSSNVFATHSSLSTDLNTPVKDPLESINSWVKSYTYSNSAIHGNGAPFSQPSLGSQTNFLHYSIGANSPYGGLSKGTSGTDSYLISPAHSKRGPQCGVVDQFAAEPRKARMLMHVDDTFNSDSIYDAPQIDWNTSIRNGYPHAPRGVINASGNVSLENIRGKIYETAKDQHGCRFLQGWLDANCDPEAVQAIMDEILPHVAELMTDQYANFLLQKLFDIMPDDIRFNVARATAPKMSMIALTPHGTFSVQKMIETVSTREEMEIVREALSKDVVRLVKDTHGNHVIQKVLQRFNYSDKQFIYDAAAEDCVAIAKNKQGCCVLQRCLEFASPTQKKALINQILACCLQVVQDPFGNYVLQYVLEANDSQINDTIAYSFLPYLVHLSVNKFSSNVMEKVLRGASAAVQEMYVETMCNPEIATRLIQDDFGNYVVQTALSVSSPTQGEALVAVIRPLMSLIRNAPYAKKLEGRMDSITRRTGGGGWSVGGSHRASSDAIGAHRDNGRGKYERAGSYNRHRLYTEPRPASWQPS